jgi:hypothetical protein
MTPERETELMDLKDRLLDALSKVDRLLCGGEPSVDDLDDEVENLDLPDDDFEDPDDDEFDPDDFDLDGNELDDEERVGVTGVVDPDGAGHKQKPIDYSGIDRTTAFKEHHP